MKKTLLYSLLCMFGNLYCMEYSLADLSEAINTKNVGKVNQIISSEGFDINQQNEGGWTALMFAAREGEAAICDDLINKGADVNMQKNDGFTALMLAAYNGKTDCVEGLLNAINIDVNVQTTIQDVSQAGNDLVKKVIIPAGATALIIAIVKGQTQIALLLIDKIESKDIDIKAVDSWTALVYAAVYGNKEILNKLIAKGADVNFKSMHGATALIHAAGNGAVEICDELISKGAKLDLQEEDGWTALIYATLNNHIDVVRLLIAKNADFNKKTTQKYYYNGLEIDSGSTALSVAEQLKHEQIVMLIKEAQNKELELLDIDDEALVSTLRDLFQSLVRLKNRLQ